MKTTIKVVTVALGVSLITSLYAAGFFTSVQGYTGAKGVSGQSSQPSFQGGRNSNVHGSFVGNYPPGFYPTGQRVGAAPNFVYGPAYGGKPQIYYRPGKRYQEQRYDNAAAAYYSGYYYPFITGVSTAGVYDGQTVVPVDTHPGEWQFAGYGNYPPDAVVVNYDESGTPVYRCRAYYRQAYFYGNAIGRHCYFRYDGQLVKVTKFKVLSKY